MNDFDVKLCQAFHGTFVGFDVASRQIIHKATLVDGVPAKELTRSLIEQADGTRRMTGKMQDHVAGIADVDDVVFRQNRGQG